MPSVKNIVEHNREMFEPDAEAVTEALEWLQNYQNGINHSYDSFGDQENEDIQLEAQDESLEESFNEQQPSHLGGSSQTEQHGQTGLSLHHQITEISDQLQPYDIVLTWCRDKIKNLNCMKPKKVEPIYLLIVTITKFSNLIGHQLP